MVKIEREIVGDGAAVNVVQQPLVTRAEQYAVMRNIGIFALHPEMNDEQRGRPAFARQSLRDLRSARMAAEQVAIAVHQVAVARDHVGGAMPAASRRHAGRARSEEHTSELPSLMRISYAVFCLKKKK